MNTRPKTLLLFLALAAATLAVYARVYQFEFITFDDNLYVTENPEVQQGLSLENVRWAFHPSQGDDETYWHPLTWLSHMLDCQLFGLNAGAHHLMNLFFHVLNVLLLFLALFLMTREPGKSAFAAALFALHPINVDSVAWIAERKNLLSTTFWMLTILAYIPYARKPSIYRYLTVVFFLALGLLAKPMLVTLPCVLLLLDFWPLKRLNLGQNPILSGKETAPPVPPAPASRLILEKLPLLCLSVFSIHLFLFTLQVNKIMAGVDRLPALLLRVENSLVSYWQYLWKLVWPVNFAFFYPFPESIPHWQPVLAALGLLMVTAFLISVWRNYPFLLIGWLWFLGTLFPVIGLVQGGLWPALADRWAYVPTIGIFIMAAWGVPAIFKNNPDQQKQLWLPAAIVLCMLGVLTFRQTGHWLNNESLYTHALKVTSGNYIAHNNLGSAIKPQGRMNEAIAHYQNAIAIKPGYADSYYNMANAFKDLGQLDKAMHYYRRTILIQPNHAKAFNNLGTLLLSQGHANEAIGHYLKAIQVRPNYESALFNLGIAYFQNGNKSLAAASFTKALQLNPNAKHIQAALEQVMKMP